MYPTHLPMCTHSHNRRYNSLVALIHFGEPCASCGLRFLEGTGEEYRKHLDWHYRMNRKDKNASRKTFRNWFMHPEVGV